MRYFIIAGEQSGDLHGSNLVRELKKADPEAVIDAWGGDLIRDAGANLLMHYARTAFMGFLVILKNLRTIADNLALCKQQITESNPDVIILIDYPAFNLRIAEFARKKGLKVFYYISPKIWAWKESRVKKIRQFVDRMYIIFPFEVEFYARHNIEVEYFGNPLVDEIERRMEEIRQAEEKLKIEGKDETPVIALLPGSRKHEVACILPHMIEVVSSFPGYRFIVTSVGSIPEDFYRRIIGGKPVTLAQDAAYTVLRSAEAALVASGTATLEAALIGTPQVVCYKGDFFSALLAWILIKVKYVSLVNLIMGRKVVTELLQYSLKRKNLVRELKAILTGGERRERMLSEYRELAEKLGPSGASARVAGDMVRRLKNEGALLRYLLR